MSKTNSEKVISPNFSKKERENHLRKEKDSVGVDDSVKLVHESCLICDCNTITDSKRLYEHYETQEHQENLMEFLLGSGVANVRSLYRKYGIGHVSDIVDEMLMEFNKMKEMEIEHKIKNMAGFIVKNLADSVGEITGKFCNNCQCDSCESKRSYSSYSNNAPSRSRNSGNNYNSYYEKNNSGSRYGEFFGDRK